MPDKFQSRKNLRFFRWKDVTKPLRLRYMWDRVFKNGPSEICGRQHLKN